MQNLRQISCSPCSVILPDKIGCVQGGVAVDRGEHMRLGERKECGERINGQ